MTLVVLAALGFLAVAAGVVGAYMLVVGRSQAAREKTIESRLSELGGSPGAEEGQNGEYKTCDLGSRHSVLEIDEQAFIDVWQNVLTNSIESKQEREARKKLHGRCPRSSCAFERPHLFAAPICHPIKSC